MRACTLSEAPSTISIQPRIAETAVCMSSSSAKPSASVSSRSRSAVTSAWSTTHPRKSGLISAKTSMASARREAGRARA